MVSVFPNAPDAIGALGRAIASCRICRDSPHGGEAFRLPHEPRPIAWLSSEAPILIAGQAPGLKVHESGLPFNDASGDRLRQWLGVDRETFYDRSRFGIAPMGFCFPGYDVQGHDLAAASGMRTALARKRHGGDASGAAGAGHRQYAQTYHLGERRRRTMTETVTHWREFLLSNRPGPRVLPLPHPSWRNTGWLKRNPWFEAEVLPVLRREVSLLIAGNDFPVVG